MRILYGLLCAVMLTSCGGTTQNNTADTETENPVAISPFIYEIEKNTAYSNLPALQSFVFGQSGDDWLLFGGRTNGFHGFKEPAEDFPFKKANEYIYVYDSSNNTSNKMPVTDLPEALKEQYLSSNMQHTQLGKYLYVTGGYGEINIGQADSSWTTYDVISRVDVPAMVSAVKSNDATALKASVVYDQNDIVRSTGGEMYRLEDDKFYLVLGQDFRGSYSGFLAGTPGSSQAYLDSVHVFTLTETVNSISIDTNSFQYISDGLADNVTEFRRRDLLVTPSVLTGGTGIGLTVYGGVFHSPSDPDSAKQNKPFVNPIYIKGGTTPSYTLDQSFTQNSNVYSAANLVMYDSAKDIVYTTAFGGMGDKALNDDFTKKVLNIAKSNNSSAIHFYTKDLPAYMGSEADFVLESGLSFYNADYGIINYDVLPSGDRVLLGKIYGGIVSNGPQWSTSNPTMASSDVYNVYITKQELVK